MDALHSVSVAKVAELLDLNNLTKEMNLKERAIECSDVNRPALQLSGYFDHFEERRIQIIGNVEYTYIEKMSAAKKKERYSRFMEFDIPCIIFCRDYSRMRYLWKRQRARYSGAVNRSFHIKLYG